LGTQWNAAANLTDGAYFTYIDNASAGQWAAVTADGSVRTTTASGITVAAGTWYKLRVEVNAAGTSATYYIDDTLVATIATNIPTTNVCGTGLKIVKTVGTTNRLVNIDYCSLAGYWSTAR
jgi:hypothetical protein